MRRGMAFKGPAVSNHYFGRPRIRMKTSVIFSTYNSPDWMEKVLWGFFVQTERDFEIIIADDGSRDDTRERIARLRADSPLTIRHVWQPDDGFQKSRILNKAIAAAQGDYLIFTDGDCIPREDFVAEHLRHADENCYLSGGYFKLPLAISKAITKDDVASQRVFSADWLRQQGMNIGISSLKLSSRGQLGDVLNRLPIKASWNGHNSSCYKKWAIAVNGFDENMQYGGQDAEFGRRLRHSGVKAKRIRYSTICVHLDHGRGYVTPEMQANSERIRLNTRRLKLKWAERGLNQYIHPDGAPKTDQEKT
jgi:glycosyltransferase involved in cell wall biosynthesis